MIRDSVTNITIHFSGETRETIYIAGRGNVDRPDEYVLVIKG